MLSVHRLAAGAEGYYLAQVVAGVEDYYAGAGEAPGRGQSTPNRLQLRLRKMNVELVEQCEKLENSVKSGLLGVHELQEGGLAVVKRVRWAGRRVCACVCSLLPRTPTRPFSHPTRATASLFAREQEDSAGAVG